MLIAKSESRRERGRTVPGEKRLIDSKGPAGVAIAAGGAEDDLKTPTNVEGAEESRADWPSRPRAVKDGCEGKLVVDPSLHT